VPRALDGLAGRIGRPPSEQLTPPPSSPRPTPGSRPNATAAGVELVTEAPGRRLGFAADRLAIERILSNLVENASPRSGRPSPANRRRRFTWPPGPHAPCGESGGPAGLSDDGPGFPPGGSSTRSTGSYRGTRRAPAPAPGARSRDSCASFATTRGEANGREPGAARRAGRVVLPVVRLHSGRDPGLPNPADDIEALARERAAARTAGDYDARTPFAPGSSRAAGGSWIAEGVVSSRARRAPTIEEAGIVRYGSAGAVPAVPDGPATARFSVLLIADDWPDDTARMLRGLRAHAPVGTQVVIVRERSRPGAGRPPRRRLRGPRTVTGSEPGCSGRAHARVRPRPLNVGLRRARARSSSWRHVRRDHRRRLRADRDSTGPTGAWR